MAYATKYDQVRKELEDEKKAERVIHRKSFIDSLIIMAVLAALFILVRFPAINPPMPDAGGGMEIISGNDLIGMGDTKESVMAGKTAQQQPATTTEPTSQPVEDPVQSNDPEAVAVKQQKPVVQTHPNPVVTTTTKVTTKPKVPDPQSDPNAEFDENPGHGGKGGKGVSKGTGTKPGDQGGNGNGNDWQDKPGTGQGPNTGPGVDLTGRSKISIPQPNKNPQLNGKDIVQIYVDRNGNVTEAHGGMRGSTITNSEIISEDEAAAKKAKFSAKDDAPQRQVGTITYVYKLK